MIAAAFAAAALFATSGSAQPSGEVPPAVQGEGAASGFLLQGALSAHTGSAELGTLSSALFFGFVAELRVGWMFDELAVAVSSSFSDRTDPDSQDSTVQFGPVVEVFLWHSSDDAVRLYALGGATFGAWLEHTETPLDEEDDKTFVAALELGFGGCYFPHPDFSFGLELGSRTEFRGADETIYDTGFFASLVVGFVAGS